MEAGSIRRLRESGKIRQKNKEKKYFSLLRAICLVFYPFLIIALFALR